jgi:hypothetical protein
MSANGATEQRSSFQRWVASLKRESQPDGTSTVAAVPGVRAKRDDDATRVHRVPKDILMRLQARAAASASESLHAERTAVFRAPPELLERAKGLRSADAPSEPATLWEEELTQPLSMAGASSAPGPIDDSGTLLDFQESTETRSGISQRPQGLGPRARVDIEEVVEAAVTPEIPEPASTPAPPTQALSSPAPSALAPSSQFLDDDSADWSPDDSAGWSPVVPSAPEALSADVDVDANVDELLASAELLVEQEPQGQVETRDRLSEPPQFRRRLGPTLVVVTWLLLAAAALVFFAQR